MATTKGKSKGSGDKWYWNWLSKQVYTLSGVLFLIIFVLFFILQFITRHNDELEVPSFAGMSVEQAVKIAEQSSLRLEVTDSVYMNRMALGAIFKQNPEAGGKVKKNRRILLTINAKVPKKVKMPSLVGFSLRQAQSELASSQLKIGKLIYVEDIATNNIISQSYKGRAISTGTSIPSGSDIDLTLGVNYEDGNTFIPNLLEVPYPLVKDLLIDNSLNLSRAVFDKTVKNYADSLEAVVYKQSPAATNTSRVPLGSAVTVYLSKNKTLVKENDDNSAIE